MVNDKSEDDQSEAELEYQAEEASEGDLDVIVGSPDSQRQAAQEPSNDHHYDNADFLNGFSDDNLEELL